MNTNGISIEYIKNINCTNSIKQNMLGELYNRNLKDLKAEYKLTTNFEKLLDIEIKYYINSLSLKYGNIFFIEQKSSITKNNQISFNYFHKSAKQQNSEAEYNIAICYYYGIGIKKNLKLALKYFEKSAKQNYSKSQYALAVIYLEGLIVKRNITTAIHYFTKASEQNHVLATIMLSAIYKFGIFCKSNEQKSIELLNNLK